MFVISLATFKTIKLCLRLVIYFSYRDIILAAQGASNSPYILNAYLVFIIYETKIEAIITGGPFDHDNITGLREDKRYFISDFLVMYLPKMLSNTTNMFRIWFHRPTKMSTTYERSPSKCIEPKRFSRIWGWRILTEIPIGMFFWFQLLIYLVLIKQWDS